MFIRPVLRLFETWIDPFGRGGDLRPPKSVGAFILFYVGQAKGPFIAMAILGGAVEVLYQFTDPAPAYRSDYDCTGRALTEA